MAKTSCGQWLGCGGAWVFRQNSLRSREIQGLAGAQILDGFVAAEQVEEGAQCLAALAFEMRVTVEDEPGVVMSVRDQLGMGGEIGQPQGRQAALPGPQDLAGAAQAQILL